MGRYSRNLAGLNNKVFVGSAGVEYSAAATLTAFIDSAVEGEIGVFLDTGVLRTTALTTGLVFQIAQKRDGFVNKTPLIKWDDLFRKLRTAYTAPVRKVVSIGYVGSGTLDIGLDFTGATQSNTLTFAITARETTPGNQPFPVQEGYATVNSATADEYTVLATIVSQLNGDYDVQRTQPDRFVQAEIQGSGTRTILAANAVLVNGSKSVTVTAHALTVGTIVSFVNVIYKIATVVDANTFLLDRPYTGPSATVTAGTSTSTASSMAYTSGTTLLGVRLTGLYDETHFTVAGNYGLTTTPVTVITNWLLGSGSGTSIKELEAQGQIFDGVGSTPNAAFSADYGLPTSFATTAGTYDQIFLDFAPSILPAAGLPAGHRQAQIERVILALPSSGTTPNNELQTIFGV